MFEFGIKVLNNDQLNKSCLIAFRNDHIKIYSYTVYIKPSVSDIFSFLSIESPMEINLI